MLFVFNFLNKISVYNFKRLLKAILITHKNIPSGKKEYLKRSLKSVIVMENINPPGSLYY